MFEEFECLRDVELAKFSTMKIGGKAKWLIFPKNVQELRKILGICEENQIQIFVLGNGSNVLFDDAGFDGVVINLRHFDFVRVCDFEGRKGENNSKQKKEILKNAQKQAKKVRFSKHLPFGVEKSYKLLENKCMRCVEVGAGINLFALNLRLSKLGLSGLEFSYGIPATLGGFLVMNGGVLPTKSRCQVVQN